MRSIKVVMGVGACSSANVTFDNTDSAALVSRAINRFSITGRIFLSSFPLVHPLWKNRLDFQAQESPFNIFHDRKELF